MAHVWRGIGPTPVPEGSTQRVRVKHCAKCPATKVRVSEGKTHPQNTIDLKISIVECVS